MPKLNTSTAEYTDLIEGAMGLCNQEHQFFIDVKLSLMKELAAARLGELANLRVLDLGCGIGSYHEGLSDEVAALYGTDVDYESLVVAKKRAARVGHATFDGTRLPFATGSLDLVFAMCVFHHVDPIDRGTLLREVYRVLRPGGVVIIGEHNPLNPLTRLVVFRCPFDEGVELLTLHESKRHLAAAGFKGAEGHYTLLIPSSGKIFRDLEHLLRRIGIGAQYLVVAEKAAS